MKNKKAFVFGASLPLAVSCIAAMQVYASAAAIETDTQADRVAAYAVYAGDWEEDTSSVAKTYNTSVSVSSSTLKQGETGTITLTMKDNPGLASWKFTLSYDPNSIEITGFNSGVFTGATCSSASINTYAIAWKNSSSGNVQKNGTIGTLKYRVKETSSTGNHTISLTPSAADIYNSSRTKIKVTTTSGKINVLENPIYKNPTVTYMAGDGCVKLNWTAVEGVKGYAVCGYVGDKWKILAKKTGTSYVIRDLKPGQHYKVVVLNWLDGKWNTFDLSKALVVSPNNVVITYPKISSVAYDQATHRFRMKWSSVTDATQYAICVKVNGSWVVKDYVAGNENTYTSASYKPGNTYTVAVCAKVRTKWYNDRLDSSAVNITVK